MRNLLCDEKNELHNRDMHISHIFRKEEKADIQNQKVNIEGSKAYIQKQKVNMDVLLIYKNELSTLSANDRTYSKNVLCFWKRTSVWQV